MAGPGSQDLIGLEEGQSGGQMGQSKTQMLLEEEANIEQLQERERSIRQLEVRNQMIYTKSGKWTRAKFRNIFFFFQSDIIDVNTIFKDLATMVHEQGEMVDSIEANVETTSVRVHEGTEQLRQAETYKVRRKTITKPRVVPALR